MFQEWFLSRRIFYVSEAGLFFECLDKLPRAETQETAKDDPWNDSDQEVMDESGWNDPPSDKEEEEILPYSFKSSVAKQDSPLESTWYELLEMYTAMDLTIAQKDRGLAVAGVAKYIRDAMVERDKEKGGTLQRYEYVSGLWLRDLHHGLLWLKAIESEEYTPLKHFPSWSWLSNSNSIRWHPIPTAQQRDRTLPAITVTRIYVDEDLKEHFSIENLVNGSTAQPGTVTGPFNVDSGFTALGITGKCATLLVCKSLKGWNGKLVQRITSGYDHLSDFLWDSVYDSLYEGMLGFFSIFSRTFRRIARRRDYGLYEICDPLIPRVLCGWASIEAPHVKKLVGECEGASLLALHISTQRGVLGGFSSGKLGLRHDVFHILFIEPVGEETKEGETIKRNQIRHRRVGMGVIFDKDLLGLFQAANQTEIILI